MQPKEMKAILKEVREAIKNKEHKIAIEKCEEVLKEDPKNYMALLLMGAAYQEKDKKEAAKYLRKALSCTNEPTIALQGLVNCAEWDELPEILKKLLQLAPEKYPEYHKKLESSSEYNKNLTSCIEILKKEVENNSENDLRRNSALKYLARIFFRQTEILKDWQNLLRPALKASIDDETIENHVEYCKRYLKHLYEIKDFEALIKEACRLSEVYPEEISILEWICKIYSETRLNNPKRDVIEGNLEKPIEIYSENLLKLNKNSINGLLIKAIKFFECDQFVQARDILRAICDIQPNLLAALLFLAHSYLKIGAYTIAAGIFRKLDKNSIEFAICLSHSQNPEQLEQAIDILNGKLDNIFDTKNLSAITSLARAYITLGKLEKAKEIQFKMNELEESNTAKVLEAQLLSSKEDPLNILDKIDDACFEANLLKGEIFYYRNDYENALNWFLKATKLKPYYSQCFMWLGRIYSATQDTIRSKKCYEKCVNLDPQNQYACTHLSAMYRKYEEWELNETLLQNTLKYLEGKGSKWALFLMGMHNISVNKYDDAIHCFRTALRYDLKDMLCWEELADAYQQRGSYNSAIKVYEKILELDPKNYYAKLQIATTKTTLRMYKEAIDCFDDLLNICSDYLPALKGAAEAHYGLANNLLNQRLLGRCKVHLIEAAKYLQRAFVVAKHDMVWLWRFMANVFVMIACLPLSKANLTVMGKLAGQEEDKDLDRRELFEYAARFYTSALKIHPDNAVLWHELSVCYYKFAISYKNEHSIKKYLNLALDTIKQSIKLNSTRWQNWNHFGVINATKEINNLALAQHCFIQALQLERKSAITWANLGVLYLTHSDDIKLANQAFQKAQQFDPAFVNGWIGQAIIAEKIAEDEEAMDLFRHCTQLGFHLESALGYGHWVCSVLSNPEQLKDPRFQYAIENMHAVPVALDSLNWYTAAEELNSCIESLSYFGYLNSKARLWRSAIKAYRAAIEQAGPADKDKLLCNIGFAYLKNDQNKEAIEAFSTVSEATIKSTTGLALAYFNSGQHEESYTVYQSALEWLAGSEEEKAIILTAMIPMIYAAQGEADTKTVLYQCIALSNAPIQALLAACALGILHKDFQLSETILDELNKFEDDPEYCHDIAFLKSQFYLANKQIKMGLIYLLKRVHLFPNNALLRGILAQYVLQNYRKSKRHLTAACHISLGTMLLGLRDLKRKTSLEAAKCLILASKAMKHVDRKMQMKLAQRAIHIHPSLSEARSALVKSKN